MKYLQCIYIRTYLSYRSISKISIFIWFLKKNKIFWALKIMLCFLSKICYYWTLFLHNSGKLVNKSDVFVKLLSSFRQMHLLALRPGKKVNKEKDSKTKLQKITLKKLKLIDIDLDIWWFDPQINDLIIVLIDAKARRKSHFKKSKLGKSN